MRTRHIILQWYTFGTLEQNTSRLLRCYSTLLVSFSLHFSCFYIIRFPTRTSITWIFFFYIRFPTYVFLFLFLTYCSHFFIIRFPNYVILFSYFYIIRFPTYLFLHLRAYGFTPLRTSALMLLQTYAPTPLPVSCLHLYV